MIDNIFKIGLLLIGVGFLIVFYLFTQNNRYQKDNNNIIFDTRTAKLYLLSTGEWVVTDPVGGY